MTRPLRPAELDLASDEGIWDFFILSEPLSRPLLDALPDLSARMLSTNGAINLQHRRRTRAGEQPARLGHVPVVVSRDGDEVRFEEYTKIFAVAVKVATRLTRASKRR